MWIFDYHNWLYCDSQAVDTEAGWQGYANWAKFIAARYKGRGYLWEFWNEPDIFFWGPQPSQYPYAMMVNRAAPAVRNAAPDCRVIGCAAAGFAYSYDWYKEVFSYGVLEHLDAVSGHAYDWFGWTTGAGLEGSPLSEPRHVSVG
jgi:hypothetical protein